MRRVWRDVRDVRQGGYCTAPWSGLSWSTVPDYGPHTPLKHWVLVEDVQRRATKLSSTTHYQMSPILTDLQYSIYYLWNIASQSTT